MLPTAESFVEVRRRSGWRRATIVALALAAGWSARTSQARADAAGTVDTKPAANLELSFFVDAYGAWQTSGGGTLATLSNHRLFSGQGATLRAENGFSLAFLGFDASYDDGHIGAVAWIMAAPASGSW